MEPMDKESSPPRAVNRDQQNHHYVNATAAGEQQQVRPPRSIWDMVSKRALCLWAVGTLLFVIYLFIATVLAFLAHGQAVNATHDATNATDGQGTGVQHEARLCSSELIDGLRLFGIISAFLTVTVSLWAVYFKLVGLRKLQQAPAGRPSLSVDPTFGPFVAITVFVGLVIAAGVAIAVYGLTVSKEEDLDDTLCHGPHHVLNILALLYIFFVVVSAGAYVWHYNHLNKKFNNIQLQQFNFTEDRTITY